jgi:hypothetical protein
MEGRMMSRYEFIDEPAVPQPGGVASGGRYEFIDEAPPVPAPGALQSFGAGVLRGAKDVVDTGAKLLATGFDKIAGTSEGQRVADMNAAGKKEFDATYGKDNTAASLGRVGGQIAATLPVGGALGAGVKAAGAAGALPKAAIPLGEAIASGGLSAQGAGMGTRMLGGAIAGGATAGLVDPDQALTGAAIGAATPLVVRGMASGMQRVGQAIRGPDVAPGVRKAAESAAESGFVVPPTMAKPSLGNRLLEGLAGKTSVAQNASMKNQQVVNQLAAKEIGLPPETTITPELLKEIRANAGQAYKAVASLPVKPAERAQPMFNKPASPEINPAQMVEDLKQARNDAQAWFRAYNRSASPEDLTKAKAAEGLSKRLESGLESYAESLGQAELLKGLRDARTLIAKTYSVERALNPTTGSVDAQTLAKLAKKGVLTGGLKASADLATAFPKAAQSVEKMGSLPQLSPLDWAAAGTMGAATGFSPVAATGLVARPLARAASLSGPVQRGLSKAAEAGSPRLGFSAADRLANLDGLALAAPVALSSRDR